MSYEDDRDLGEPVVKVIADEVRTARAPHKCVCGHTIERGERYRRFFEIVDGQPSILKKHLDEFVCIEAAWEEKHGQTNMPD